MVQFAKKLLQAQRPEWNDHYLKYKQLKKRLKQVFAVAKDIQSAKDTSQEGFKKALDSEVEKIVLFLLCKQGEIASTLSNLREQQATLAMSDIETMRALADGYRRIGDELVQLLYFVELNATGLRKILKKHDKTMQQHKIMGSYLTSRTESQASHLQQLYHDEGISAIIATIRSALTELRRLEDLFEEGQNGTRTSSVSIPTTMTRSISVDEPVLNRIAHARRRLQQSTHYVKTIAAQALIFDTESSEDEEENATQSYKRHAASTSEISRVINMMCTFIYMMNYYIVAPTSANYAAALGEEAAFSGIIVGMTPVASLASAILYSWWANRSYKSPLIFATICLVIGNFMYGVALHYNSLWLAILGRLLNGFGGARSINRRYIADNYTREERTQASAMFVTVSALGMSAGPAIAAALDYVPDFSVLDVRVTVETAPGWVMCFIWLAYLLGVLFYFEEPERRGKHIESSISVTKCPNEKTALLTSHHEPVYSLRRRSSTMTGPVSLSQLWSNVPVVVSLVIYIILKLVLECLITSSSSLAQYYFAWNSTTSGLYLAALGLLMFPTNVLVSRLTDRYEDRYMMLLSECFMTIGIIIFIHYGTYTITQFIAGGIVIFISTNVLEGVNMSLLSKTIPKAFAKGTFNSGLLATEAGTLGRALGDIAIALIGIPGMKYVLNYTFFPLLVISVGTTLYTVFHYKSLVTRE
uniref:Major Facilitator Superfamily (MFS) putative n=1 Tax=Albugo laibachii Nc14 TaxID=890382 RepID=F0W6U2_9STRA|nr:Major Facilitator Superfamily (MFS) putative [Albugo laibachii Nc14]|eukprot:CCA16837.1 Major Facilitator Superfamily (MFS) putative [Albugo laibachii Nc14]